MSYNDGEFPAFFELQQKKAVRKTDDLCSSWLFD